MRIQVLISLLAAATMSKGQVLPFSHNPPVVRPDQIQLRPPAEEQVDPSNTVSLFDVLGGQRSISIFASFTRDIDAISSRLESQTMNTTLLAPLNSALSALPRKPWEDPKDYAELGANAYEGNKGSERAAKNMERFVQAHVVPKSPWLEGVKVKSLVGDELWWETKDDKTIVMPQKIEVERIAKQVGNGEVWILQNVINYS